MEEPTRLLSRWKDEYQAKWQDCDRSGKINIRAISQYLQETAWHHAHHLGFGYYDLIQQNRAWVLYQLIIEMFEFPLWNDKFTIETWPRELQSVKAMRDFRIYSEKDQLIGQAASVWMVIDMDTRRPQKLSFMEHSRNLLYETAALNPKNMSIGTLPELSEVNRMTVRYSEIDFNKHVNTSNYFDWVMNSISENFRIAHTLKSFNIVFQSECLLGETIVIHSDSNSQMFRGYKSDVNMPAFTARLEWRPA